MAFSQAVFFIEEVSVSTSAITVIPNKVTAEKATIPIPIILDNPLTSLVSTERKVSAADCTCSPIDPSEFLNLSDMVSNSSRTFFSIFEIVTDSPFISIFSEVVRASGTTNQSTK